jgi:hypothetical protein
MVFVCSLLWLSDVNWNFGWMFRKNSLMSEVAIHWLPSTFQTYFRHTSLKWVIHWLPEIQVWNGWSTD